MILNFPILEFDLFSLDIKLLKSSIKNMLSDRSRSYKFFPEQNQVVKSFKNEDLILHFYKIKHFSFGKLLSSLIIDSFNNLV